MMSCEDFHAECAEGGSPYDPFFLLMEVYNPFRKWPEMNRFAWGEITLFIEVDNPIINGT